MNADVGGGLAINLRCRLLGHTWVRPKVMGEARSVGARNAEGRSGSAVCRILTKSEDLPDRGHYG
jgi:hypothetical protein